MEKVPVTIKEATVYYSEGQPEKVPIGEINVVWDQKESLLEMSSSRGSTDGTGAIQRNRQAASYLGTSRLQFQRQAKA